MFVSSSGEEKPFNWLDLIAPSLKLFFEQIETDLKSETEHYSSIEYIPAIDSLTMKFEGLLREFLLRIGSQTIKAKSNKTEEIISYDTMLSDEKILRIISENDIAFFKFLFTSKGLDLRNNVAHSFYKPFNYKVNMMWLLIVAFLKLGNYELIETKE